MTGLRQHRREWRSLWVATICTVVVAAGACTTTPTDHSVPHVELVGSGFELSWPATAPAGATYVVERMGVGPSSPHGWTRVAATASTSATDTGVVVGDTYMYRLGVGSNGSTPKTWSISVRSTFVTPTLPVLRISTTGHAPVTSTDVYVPGTVAVEANGSPYQGFTAAVAQVRARGNSTAAAEKKPYKVKLDKKASVLGLPAEKDWVLLANWFDRSNLRNVAALDIGAMVMPTWTPHHRLVEVVLNGDYRGVYLLTEQVEVGPDRVAVTEMTPQDVTGDAVTGGYLIEVDARLEENHEPGFRSSMNVPVVVKDPEPAEPQQMVYIRSWVDDVERRLRSPDRADPTKGYRAVLDEESLVDWYLVQEVTRNQDVGFSSAFLHKDRGGILRFGPLWDFDLSIGSQRGVAPQPVDGWQARTRMPWGQYLFQDPTLITAISTRWAEVRDDVLAVAAALPVAGASISTATLSDAARWGPSPTPAADDPAFLRSWMEQRVAWLDSQYPTP